MLGTLGGLATIGGALIPGAQWLTPLGMGLGMVSGQSGGGSGTNNGYMSKILNDIVCGDWYNPASGSLAKKPGDDSDILPIIRGYMNTSAHKEMKGI